MKGWPTVPPCHVLARFAAACGSESAILDASVQRQEQLQGMPAAPPLMCRGNVGAEGTRGWGLGVGDGGWGWGLGMGVGDGGWDGEFTLFFFSETGSNRTPHIRLGLA